MQQSPDVSRYLFAPSLFGCHDERKLSWRPMVQLQMRFIMPEQEDRAAGAAAATATVSANPSLCAPQLPVPADGTMRMRHRVRLRAIARVCASDGPCPKGTYDSTYAARLAN